MRVRFCALVSLLFCILLFGSACSGDVPDDTAPKEPESGMNDVLTSVFDFERRDYREDTVYLEQGVVPWYDAEGDTFRFVVTEIGNESGAQNHRLVSLAPDGTSEDLLSFSTGDSPAESISRGRVSGESLILLTSEFGAAGQEYSLVLVDAASGKTRRADGIGAFLANPFAMPIDVTAGADSFVVVTQTEAAVFDENLLYQFSVSSDETVTRAAADENGDVWLCLRSIDGSYRAARIDHNAKALTDSVPLSHSGDAFLFCGSALCTGSGGSLRTTDRASGAEELFFSYVNSGYMPSEFTVLSVPDHDRIAGANTMTGAFYTGRRNTSLRAQDFTFLTVAMTQGEDALFSQNLVRFRRLHPEVQFSLLDYSDFSEDNPNKGADRLKLELSTGTVSPDVLISGTENSSNSMWEYALEHDLLSDLTGTVNTDDRLGCTVRTFSDEGDRLLGLCRDFTVFFTIARAEEIESYGPDWTAENALAFVEKLPEKSLAFPYPTQSGYQNFLYDKIVRFCVESDPVSFQNDLFTRYLQLLGTYPPTLAEALNLPAGVPMMDVYGDVYLDYLNGNIHTYDAFLTSVSRWIGLQSVFGSDAFAILDGKTKTVSATFYSVLAKSGKQALAADFVRFMTDAEQGYMAGDGYTPSFWMGQIPASKTELKKQEKEAEGDWLCSMKTRMMQRAYAGIQPGAEDMLLTATGDYLDRLTDYLDHDCASDIFRVPEEVSAIIQEEISACLGGATTPEKCGENIESRVSIWLAEHR